MTEVYITKHFRRAWETIKEDIKHPTFDIFFLLLVALYVWAEKFQINSKVRRASQGAMLAFIIAYLSRMDLVFVAATIVFIVIMIGHNVPGEE